ncbi:MAG TPA: hypothetical protein VES42_01050 [Pilimelia sp.]|nr:hypothetical protein [Pilimelia sp.]
MLGGSLANRWGRVRVVRWSSVLTVVATAGVVYVPGPALYLFVALTSAGLYLPFSLLVTLGQDYLPTRARPSTTRRTRRRRRSSTAP